MNATEAVRLCRYVKAACPQQAIDEWTPQAWADLLTDVRYEDAQQAVRALAQRQPFIAPSEVITEVKRIRTQRADQGDHALEPPPFTTVADYQAWLKEARRRLADGETPDQINAGNQRGELKPRTLREIGARHA